MSLAELRTLLVGASLGEGPVAQLAKLALETWGAEATTAGVRKRPLTNAEKCARRRLRRKGVDPDADTGATPNDTGATPETTPSDTANGSAPSRALPLSPSPVSSLSSSPSPSSSEPKDPDGSSGTTGAREGAANGATGAELVPTESGTFRLETPAATPSDTARDTKRHRRDTARDTITKAHRIPTDWQPSADTRAGCEARGVDVAQAVPEFVSYWEDEADARNRKALKTARGWDRTFRNRVDWLLANNRVPMLPPAPERPAPAGDPHQAKSILDVLNGNALPAIYAAKEGKHA